MSSDYKTVTGVRVEALNDADKRMLGLDIGPKQPLQFLDTARLSKFAEEQRTALSSLTGLAQQRDQKIAALDKELPADVRARRAREIATQYEPQITKLRTEIDGRATLAEANRFGFDLRNVAARGRFSGADHEHATVATMWGAKLNRQMTVHLLEFAASIPGQGPQAPAYASLLLDELDARESEPFGSPRHVSRSEREKILAALEGVPTVHTEMHAGRALIDEISLGARQAKIANGEGNSRDLIAAGLLRGDLMQ